jgi:hypothetical protein
MMRFVPTPEITAYDLAQLLSNLHGLPGLGSTICVDRDNPVPGLVEKFFREAGIP